MIGLNFLWTQDQIEGLTSELKLFNELKRRAEECTLKRDLQRNIEVCYESGDLLAKRASDSCSIQLYLSFHPRLMAALVCSGNRSRRVFYLSSKWSVSVYRTRGTSCCRWKHWYELLLVVIVGLVIFKLAVTQYVFFSGRFLHFYIWSLHLKKLVIHFVKQVICFILRHWEIMHRIKSRCIICAFMCLFECGKLTYLFA